MQRLPLQTSPSSHGGWQPKGGGDGGGETQTLSLQTSGAWQSGSQNAPRFKIKSSATTVVPCESLMNSVRVPGIVLRASWKERTRCCAVALSIWTLETPWLGRMPICGSSTSERSKKPDALMVTIEEVPVSTTLGETVIEPPCTL